MPDTTTGGIDRGYTGPLERVDDCTWRIPRTYKPGMLADGLIFTDERMLPQLVSDRAPEQVANVACLPGIQGASLAMPDIHWGYGFCIGACAPPIRPPGASSRRGAWATTSTAACGSSARTCSWPTCSRS